ncbi:MAG: hypothetical protein ABI867_45430, partial [Kofleriaceae bacterium]
MRASLTSLGRRLPDLTADLALLADLVDQNAPDALARTRAVVDKVLAAIGADDDIVIDGGTETMLETLLEKQVIPLAIAAQVRAVHDRENTLVGDAVRALVGFLEWRIGSRAHLRYIPKPPKRRRIVAILIAAITAATIAIVIAAWPRPARDLASGAMVQIAGATLELGSRPQERQAALALCRTIEHRPDCELANEELAQEHARTVTISAFEIDRHEVTVSAYAEWLTREPPAPDNLVALPNIDYDRATEVYSVKPDRQQLP